MNSRTATDTGTALWIKEKSHDLDNLLIDVIETAMPTPGPGQVIVEIKAAGVNPSDVRHRWAICRRPSGRAPLAATMPVSSSKGRMI